MSAGAFNRRYRLVAAGVRDWQVWRLPSAALVWVLSVELIACALCVLVVIRAQVGTPDLFRTVGLAALAIVSSELTVRLQRMRRYLSSYTLISMDSIWGIAAVLLLPAANTAVLIAFLYAYGVLRRSHTNARPFRWVYTGAATVLAALLAHGAARVIQPDIGSLPGVPSTAVAAAAAIVTFLVANAVLIAVTIRLAVGRVSLLPAKDELTLELATLVLGVFTAEMLLRLPLFTPMVLVLVVLLQRSSLVSQLEVAATTDAKTGLLNATAWQELAQRELLRAQRDKAPCAVLLLDLDHFKLVNDTHGHLAGDEALRAVADSLKKELRGYDAIARFGGEEFVVFLNDLAIADARQVAERTLARIRGLVIASADSDHESCTVTASIGMSAYPDHGQDLTDLLEAADAALYAAKSAGRDRVGEPYFPEPAQHPRLADINTPSGRPQI